MLPNVAVRAFALRPFGIALFVFGTATLPIAAGTVISSPQSQLSIQTDTTTSTLNLATYADLNLSLNNTGSTGAIETFSGDANTGLDKELGTPSALVTAQSTNVLAKISAQLTYQVGVLSVTGAPTGQSVPVSILSQGSALAKRGGEKSVVRAEVDFYIGSSLEGSAVSVDEKDLGRFASKALAFIPDDSTISLSIVADGSIGGGGSIKASVDPQVIIDPTATFLLDGVPTRYADVYQLVFSPGILPVPEPMSAALLAVGGTALTVWRPRRRS